MNKGLIYNIQRYNIHDGGGIRTIVFFKGCPLKCPWCCNPESQNRAEEYIKKDNLCLKCPKCFMNEKDCPSGAYEKIGRMMTTDEILKEIQKDELFYEKQGGVTLSGGEVLLQSGFAAELLCKIKQLFINTAVETSGQGSLNDLKAIAKYTDVFLYDLKIMNGEKAKKLLGADIDLIKANMEYLVGSGKSVIPRIPLIPGYTIDEENILSIMDFIKRLKLIEVHILPFHQLGSNKYVYLKRNYLLKDAKPLGDRQVKKIQNMFQDAGFTVNIGGL